MSMAEVLNSRQQKLIQENLRTNPESAQTRTWTQSRQIASKTCWTPASSVTQGQNIASILLMPNIVRMLVLIH